MVFRGGGPLYVTYIFWGGWRGRKCSLQPPKVSKILGFGTILDDRQIDQTCFQPMADPGTYSWRGEHSIGVPRSNTDVPGSASGRSGNIHADEIIGYKYNRRFIEIY